MRDTTAGFSYASFANKYSKHALEILTRMLEILDKKVVRAHSEPCHGTIRRGVDELVRAVKQLRRQLEVLHGQYVHDEDRVEKRIVLHNPT